MTRVINPAKHGDPTILIIEPEDDAKCEMCGNVEELRPYGPRGENVCFTCGMKDRAAAERQFARRLGKAIN